MRVVCADCSEFRTPERTCAACVPVASALSTRAANVERQWMAAALNRALAAPSDAPAVSGDLCRLVEVHGGVALHSRARVWPVLSGSVELAAANAALYALFVEQCDARMRQFVQIDADRALPGDPRFGDAQGRASLVRLLCAHVFRTGKRDVLADASEEDSHRRGSYRQEMLYLASVLLRVFADEESAFWCFTQLLYQFDIARYFLDGAPLLTEHLVLFERLVARHEPALARHFDLCLISIELFAKRWFTTLFSLDLPVSAVLRLWDLVLVRGPRWALPRMGVAMLRLARDELMQCAGSSDLLTTLQAVPARVAPLSGDLFVIVHALE